MKIIYSYFFNHVCMMLYVSRIIFINSFQIGMAMGASRKGTVGGKFLWGAGAVWVLAK